jgi:hypothetical protein
MSKTTKLSNAPLLREAATFLLNNMKTPEELLLFITNSINWIDQHQFTNPSTKENQSCLCQSTVLIESLVIPWYATKDKGSDNVIDALAEGIYNLHDTFGCEGLMKYMQAVLSGIAIEQFHTEYPTEQMVKDMNQVAMMYGIGNYLNRIEIINKLSPHNPGDLKAA